MQADERTRVVIHREWILDTPAHYTEVANAIAAAGQKGDAETGRATDVVLTHGDGEIVIGYEVEVRHSGELGRAVDEILRAERDALTARLSNAEAAIARVRGEVDGWNSSYQHLKYAIREALDGVTVDTKPDGGSAP